MIGKTLGHYRIVEKLGRGGMGEVYRAHDTSLERDVALKVLPEEMAGDPARVKRFEREAKAVAALKHPNIVTIHAVENVDGVHFLAMELVEGQTLAEIIPSGGLPLDRIFEIAIPLSDALSAAHAKGITHRDLKPANVMFDADGRVKVLDFGLAKLFTPSDEGDATVVGDDSVTAEGKVLGTVSYMSPEQAEGKALDHRSDIFSLGVVLYEMTTGQRPFAGDTPISTISAILKDTPTPVTGIKTTLPRHMGRVIGRCMEKNPDKRFQTARDVCNELEGLQKEVESGEIEVTTGSISRETVEMAMAARRRRSPWPFVGTAVVVIALAVAGYALFLRKPPEEAAPAVTTKLVTSLVGVEEPGSWSPDGGFIAYSHAANGPMDIFIVATAGGDAIRLVESPGDDILPRWSPDNRWIAFASNRDGTSAVYLVPPLGGSVQKLVGTGFARLDGFMAGTLGGAPWTPDGRTLVFARRGDDGAVAIWKIDMESRTETQLSHPGAGEFDMAAAVSFAGDRVAFNRSTAGGAGLFVVPLSGGDPRKVYSEDTQYLVPAWAPDDRSVVYSSEEGGLWSVDVATGKNRQLTAGASHEGGPVTAKSGRILFATFSHQTDLYVQNIDGSGEERLTFHTQDNFGPRFSPDGKKVVYMSTRSGDPEVWLLDLTSGNERQLTSRNGRDGSPDWNPNGREILFASDRDGKPQLWVMDVDGGAPRKLCDRESGGGLWAPDGSRVGFVTSGPSGMDLWTVPAAGGEATKVLDDVAEFDWYRDARHVIYRPEARGSGNEMHVVDLDSGKDAVLLSEPNTELSVAPDGSAVDYCSATSHYNMNLHILRLKPPAAPDGLPTAVGAPVKITHGDGKWHVHNGGWSPDGKRVIYTRDTDTGDLSILDGAFAK